MKQFHFKESEELGVTFYHTTPQIHYLLEIDRVCYDWYPGAGQQAKGRYDRTE